MKETIYHGCKRLHEPKKFNNIKEIIENTKKEFGNLDAVKFKTNEPGKFRVIKYKDYVDDVNGLGTALISIGLKDKRIAVIGENSMEWAQAYLSIVCGTGVVVPLDKALPENEIRDLIERSEVEAIFYTDKYDLVREKVMKDELGKVKYFISMSADKTEGKIYSQKELVKLGKDLIKNGARSFLDAEIKNEEMSIMLFTSGTTSKSKAVMLSHKNICTNIYDISSIFDLGTDDVLLSFLPLHHTFESTVGFLYPVSVGSCIAYCEGIRHIADNLKDYQITGMIAVPILFENMYKKVMKAIEKKGKAKKVKIGMKISNFLMKFGIDKRREIFKDIHANFGGKLRIFVAGAAAFDPETEKGFTALGINTYQGYGLTEASPVIAAEHPTCVRVGSIGKPLPSLKVKVVNADENGVGEIVATGDSVMMGYYNNEEATKATLEDGWLRTGDLGFIDKDGYIHITGREKNVIVLKNGKNIYPEEIEAKIEKIEGVKEVMVYGKPEEDDDNDLKICAKIVYNKDILDEMDIDDEDEIKDYLWKKIKEINKTMPAYKYVREITVTEEDLIKTTTQKVKRFEEIKKMDKKQNKKEEKKSKK